MEVLAEVLLALLQFVGEIILQILFEGLAEFGSHAFKRENVVQKPRSPLTLAAGYFFFGGIIGLFSLMIFPKSFIQDDWIRLLNLLISPFISGLFMAMIGVWRRKRNQKTIGLDQFNYGFIFALAMALVRYFWTQ